MKYREYLSFGLLAVSVALPTPEYCNGDNPVMCEGGQTDPFPGVTSQLADTRRLALGEHRMKSINASYHASTNELLCSQPWQNATCTTQQIAVRKEWGNLSPGEKKEYIQAVQCLRSKPAKTSRDFAPGARTRWDDFVVAHIINTKSIHFSGLLLPWHREFVHLLESALRDECGFTGFQPYWDWSKHAFVPMSDNPVYNGDDTSLGSNGRIVPHRGNLLQPGGNPRVSVWVPPGTGGGCIARGPFAQGKWSTNLGPVAKLNDSAAGPPNPREDGLGYNPRCVKRDFGPDLLKSNSNYWNVSTLILNNTDIHTFHPHLEMAARGIHGTGHTFIGGLNNDLFSSPGDPLFFLHHGMIDRVWSMWQSRDFEARTYGLSGTMTSFNWPHSEKVTLDDQLYYSPVFQNVTIRDIMSVTRGKYCYIYE